MTSDPIVGRLSGPDAAMALDELRRTAPVTYVAPLRAWLVTGHEVATAVMRDAATFTVDDPRFSTAQVVGASMLSTDGVPHRRHRKPFAPPFRPAALEHRYAPGVRELTDELLGRIRDSGAADLRTALAGPLSVSVVAHALGLDEVDVPTVLGWYAAIVGAVTEISSGGDPGPGGAAAVQALGDAVRAGLDVAPDSVLARARDSLADGEIVSNAAVMMFGGIETTEGMIANLIVHLLTTPGAVDRVRDEPTSVGAAIEESLRLEPAAAVIDRYAAHDVDLDGARIARGDLVRVSITGANRDPSVFADPDRFDLDRPNVRDHLAFARGPHACLAMDLARLETRLALEGVLALPELRLAGAAPVTGLVFRKPTTVPVTWVN